MIVEELAAKFGFQIDGLNKLRTAIKQFGDFRKEALATANPLKASAASTTLVAAGMSRAGAEAKKSSRSILLFSTALGGLRRAGAVAGSILRSILAVAVRLVGAFAGLAAGLVGVAAAFTVIGAKAALARREMRLMAATIGTTAQSLETATNAFRYLGLGDGAKDAAKKAVGSIDDILKAIKKGGAEADEAKKKLSGFGFDGSLGIGKDGKMRDSVAVLFDAIQAYKKLTEEAAAFRAQANGVNPKNAKRAAALRSKALAKERAATGLAEGAGIDDRLKVVIDEKSLSQILALVERAGRERPTTSNVQEKLRKEVADQAIDIGLKADAVLEGLTERFTDLSVVVAGQVLPAVNSFFDSVLSFAKKVGIIPETVKEQADRLSYERAGERAAGIRAERSTTEDLEGQAAKSQQRYEDDAKRRADRRRLGGTPTEAPFPPARPNSLHYNLRGRLTDKYRQSDNVEDRRNQPLETSLAGMVQWLKSYVSPEANAAKMQKQAETNSDQRKYENIGNDYSTISPSITVQATGLEAVAAAVRNSVLGAISTKGANTSTGALTAP